MASWLETIHFGTLSSIFMGALTVATAVGSYFAGRKSYSATVASNDKQLRESWQNLYTVSQEEAKQLHAKIEGLYVESQVKDKLIAELTTKVDTIMEILRAALNSEALRTSIKSGKIEFKGEIS